MVHVDEEWVIELAEELPLVHNRVHRSFRDDSAFEHLFHGVHLSALLLLDLPHLAKASFPNDIMELEMIFGDG